MRPAADIAHARISAEALGCDTGSYLAQLPWERTAEIHMSGPRRIDGRLVDRHEPMVEEDLALLRWVLERAWPQAVTLEFSKDRAQVRDQLLHLRRLLDDVQTERVAGPVC